MDKAELLKKLEAFRARYRELGLHPNPEDIDPDNLSDHYMDMAAGLSEAIRLAGQLAEPQWISVDERLPEKKGNYFSHDVLVTVEFEHIKTQERFTDVDKYDYEVNRWFKHNIMNGTKVIGWMPKPEPMK